MPGIAKATTHPCHFTPECSDDSYTTVGCYDLDLNVLHKVEKVIWLLGGGTYLANSRDLTGRGLPV